MHIITPGMIGVEGQCTSAVSFQRSDNLNHEKILRQSSLEDTLPEIWQKFLKTVNFMKNKKRLSNYNINKTQALSLQSPCSFSHYVLKRSICTLFSRTVLRIGGPTYPVTGYRWDQGRKDYLNKSRENVETLR